MTDVGSELDPEGVLKKSTIITVTAERLEFAPWVFFWMTANYPNQGGKKLGEFLKFDKRAGEFDLTFNLIDNSGLHLKFYELFEDAMWVQVGAVCPPAGPGDGDGAIVPGTVFDFSLEATNVNGKGALLTFMLRFTGDHKQDGGPPYEFDPKIINGGQF